MRKFLSALVVPFLFGSVLAAGLPTQGRLALVTGDGTIVGVGELEDGNFELDLLAGFTDFAVLVVLDEQGNPILDEDGNPYSFDLMVGADGSLILADSFENLASLVNAAGGEVDVSFEEKLEVEVELPEDAEEAAERAVEEAEEAAERAAEEAEEAAERAAEEAEEAAERAAEEAEDAAEEAEEAAERNAEEAEEAAERAAEEAEDAAEEAEEAAERNAEEAEEAAGNAGRDSDDDSGSDSDD